MGDLESNVEKTPLSSSPGPMWRKPDEVMQLHRLKRKKRVLQERMKQPLYSSHSSPDLSSGRGTGSSLNFSKLLGSGKRKNPFSKNATSDPKKFCDTLLDESTDSTLFQLLGMSTTQGDNNSSQLGDSNERLSAFTSLYNKITKEQNSTEEKSEIPKPCGKKYVPIDWSLKTKVRFMSPRPFAWTTKLKASEEASGITGFVRCLDTSKSCTLDTSHHSRFHQHCLYWQHPNLPWVNLFPRTTGKVSNKSFIASNEEVKEALHKEWTESFRSLFQLVRARQCPYFYVCANTFTCLFQAGGIGGIEEVCAYLGPTTRGLRQVLKQEDIEFTMPLRKNYPKRKSDEMNDKGGGETPKNTSLDSCYDTMDNTTNGQSPGNNGSGDNVKDIDDNNESGDEDDLESEQWLQSLGVAEDEIRKINYSQLRVTHSTESVVDSGVESLIYVQGVDAQALFNFLLNCKSSIPVTGPFGGIPPTLLAPTAFQGGTLQPLKARESIVHSNGTKYYSVELRGPILPTTVQTLCLLLHSNGNSFSGTFANLQQTLGFTKASKIISEVKKSQMNQQNVMASAFGKENLSDCGLSEDMLDHFCSSDPQHMETIDCLAYSREKDSYTWS